MRKQELFDKFEIVNVIKLSLIRGRGTSGDPCRVVEAYYDMKGNLLVEIDPQKKEVDITS